MTTSALQRHAFSGEATNRKRREFLIALALNDHRSAATLCRLYAKQRRRSSRAYSAVDDDVDTASARELLNDRQRILCLDVDHSVGSEGLCYFKPSRVFGRARDDDERGARLPGRHQAAESLLTWTLNEHCRGVANAAVDQR